MYIWFPFILAPVNDTSAPNRRGRKPKHITHIAPPTTSSMTASTNVQQNEETSNHNNDNSSSQGEDSTCQLQLTSDVFCSIFL